MPRVIKSNSESASGVGTGSAKALPIIIVLSTLLFAALLVAGYFYYQYRQLPQVQSTEEIAEFKEMIGKIFDLPTDEEPTLATVTDREKLAEQPFFQKAENGDKVLIYSASGRAILYRPSMGKIIDVTTVNVNQPVPEAPTPVPTVSEPALQPSPAIVRVVLYNGSSTVGLTNTVEQKLKTILPNLAVVAKESARKNDYTQTIVVDVTGQSSAVALEIAGALGGEVGVLPEGEVAPVDADILVLVAEEA